MKQSMLEPANSSSDQLTFTLPNLCVGIYSLIMLINVRYAHCFSIPSQRLLLQVGGHLTVSPFYLRAPVLTMRQGNFCWAPHASLFASYFSVVNKKS